MGAITILSTIVTINPGSISIGNVGIQDPVTGAIATVTAAGADGGSNTSNRLGVRAQMEVFNGLTWDRAASGLVVPQNAPYRGLLNTITMGRYFATASTLTDGQVSPVKLDVNGFQIVTLGTTIAGEDPANDILKTETRGTPVNITTNATTVIKSGAGVLYGFTVNNNGFTTAGTITIYDNTAASGTKIGTWTIPIQPPGTTLLATTFFPPALQLNVAFSTGLTFVTATTAPAADITVSYR